MRAFYRLLGEHSPGGGLVERKGLLAAIVPSCPNQSVVNAVVYEDALALKECRDRLEAAYVRAGVRSWRVWVPEGDRAVGEWLEQSGHRLSGGPRAMTLDLVAAEFDVSDELDWERTNDVATLASLNEQAYGVPTGEFAQALTALAGDSVGFTSLASTEMQRPASRPSTRKATAGSTRLPQGPARAEGDWLQH